MADLSNSPIGSLIAITGTDYRHGDAFEARAYVPNALPKTLEFDTATWLAITRATAALARLDAVAQMVPNPGLLTRTATRREAIGTSAIEGTVANLDDVYAAEVRETTDRVPTNVQEVVNYIVAADHAYDWILERNLPMSWGLLAEVQRTIVDGTDADSTAGQLRSTQVFIGAHNRPIAQARFIPAPPGAQLRHLIDGLFEWHEDDHVREAMPLLARVALTHYQFETIHPFTDGNGRVGRLAAVLQLLEAGALHAPVLSISTWLRDHDAEYRDQLLALSESGSWDTWIQFFATAVEASATDTHGKVLRLLELRDELLETAKAALPRARLALELVQALIEYPVVSVSSSQRRLGRTNQANRNAIAQLCDIGLLQPYLDTNYGQLYWNPRVLGAIEQ